MKYHFTSLEKENKSMIIPHFLSKGDKIGVTATSGGVTNESDIKRFENSKKNLEKYGYKSILTDDVFKSDGFGRSTDAKQRYKEFKQLIQDEDVKLISLARGGDFLAEMLPYVDYEMIRTNPKWIQGYSDSTAILYSIATKLDMATIYGNHFGDYGMKEWHRAVSENMEILEGNRIDQNSFEFYEDEYHDRETGLESYSEDMKTSYKTSTGNAITLEGILLGGCLDVLDTIAGTKYEDTLGFIKRHKEEQIIWYLESFACNSESVILTLWKLKELGWFESAAGFVFGRPKFYETSTGNPYNNAVMTILKDLNVPIIFDADIGHKPPQWTMINCLKARIAVDDNMKAKISYIQLTD